MHVTTLIAPAAEPLGLAEAKEYLRIAYEGENSLVMALIAGARARIEALAGVAMIARTLRVTLDRWPARTVETRVLRLPVRPAGALSAVRVFDASGAALKSGQLVGTVSGVMRYAGTGLPEPAPDAPATDPIRLMRAALADFHYTGLTLTLERAASGEGSLLVHLKGANPQVLDNHPFVFNIRLDANFDKIAAILLDGYAAAEDLIRRGGRP